METKILKVNQKNIDEAAALLKAGEVVAFPTETVYGLGADATNEAAIEKIFTAKGRPSDNPLIVHVASKEQLKKLVASYPSYVDRLIDAFSPGPITYVLERKGNLAHNVTANLETVGVRIPQNETALRLLREVNLPIAAPSANLSGKPSPTKAAHVYEDLHGKIAAILDANHAHVGLESTVVDCTSDVPLILRDGSITAKEIKEIVGVVQTLSKKEKMDKPKSPGLKYKHYAPEIPLLLVEDVNNLSAVINEYSTNNNRIALILEENIIDVDERVHKIIVGSDIKEVAKHLYDILRSLKKGEFDIVISQSFSEEGVGKAVMDRLRRAASNIL